MKFDLEDRLVEFSAMIIDTVEILPNSRAGNYIANQMIRCGLSPALNYGEAQSAESRNDFIHKMKIALKELRETMMCLKIIRRKTLISNPVLIESVIKETNELTVIFVKSISTARANNQK